MQRDYIKEPRKALRTMPKTIIIMSSPKLGKTAITAELTTKFARGNSQVITLGDEGGFDNVEANVINFKRAYEFEKYLDDLIVDRPFSFLILDHLSILNEWSDPIGTLEYMGTNIGKNFNLKAKKQNEHARGPGFNKDTMDKYFLPGDPDFESVTTLPDGAGWRYPRAVALRWYKKLKRASQYLILLGHPKIDRYTKNDKGLVVNTSFLDMTSGVSRAICKDVDSLATFHRKKEKGFLSFKHGSSDMDAGTRYAYLEGQDLLISEKTEEGLNTYWEAIYPDYK